MTMAISISETASNFIVLARKAIRLSNLLAKKWNSAAFAYAHKQLHAIETNPELTAQMEAAFEAAQGKAPNGKTYTTAHAWKFNSLLWEWKQEHPFNDIISE